MTRARRLRLVLLASGALGCALLAMSIVDRERQRVRAQVGPLVPVLIGAQRLPSGKRVTDTNAAALFTVRRVPASFAPPQALRSPQQAVGYRADASIAPGDYVTSGMLSAPGGVEQRLRTTGDGRLVEVAVAGGATVLGQLEAGSTVDVVVTTDRAGSRSYLALQRVELVQVGNIGSDTASSGSGESHADTLATLRVGLRDAVMLTAAQNFAREIRLVPRPAGDDSASPAAVVSASELRP